MGGLAESWQSGVLDWPESSSHISSGLEIKRLKKDN
jgi:hypothetical protein